MIHDQLVEREVSDAQLDGLMRATQVLVGVIAESTAVVEEPVTLAQLRVLVVASESGPLSPGEVADLLSVHPSNATRTCDKLVAARLLHRRESPHDRRRVELVPTRLGHRVVATVMARRRTALLEILSRMAAADRARVSAAFAAFADAAGADSP